MANKPSTLLSTLLDQLRQKQSNTDVLRGAWHLAVRSKDIEAMATIASAENIPDDVLKAVESRNEIPVAVSYLTRSGLDLEERRARFRAEERAGVLAGALSSDSLTDDDRIIIAAKLVAKPTRTLSEAVIMSGNLPLDATVVAISQLDSRTNSLTDEQSKYLRKAVMRVASDPIWSLEAAKVINDTGLAQRFIESHPPLDEDSFTEFFARTYEPRIKEWAEVASKSSARGRVTSLLRDVLGQERDYHPTLILAAIQRHLDTETAAQVWTDLVGATRAASDTSDTSDYSKRMLAASTTNDEAVLEELVTEAIGGQSPLIAPLIDNPNLPFRLLSQLGVHVDDRYIIRALASHPKCEETATLVYTLAFDRAVREDKWKAFETPEAGKAKILKIFSDNWSRTPNSTYSSESRQLLSCVEEIEDQEVLGDLPWDFVRQMLSSGYGSSQKLAQIACKVQSDALGSDMKKWETAEVLANQFSGSLRELVNAAAAL